MAQRAARLPGTSQARQGLGTCCLAQGLAAARPGLSAVWLLLARLAWGLLMLAWAATVQADALDASAFEALLQAHDPHTVEEVLALLPAPFREHYVLMFSSRSLQQGSMLAPRAIVFGQDGRFILSFNGQAQQRGFEALETLSWDPLGKRFSFRELQFEPDAQGVRHAHLSAPNPPKCLACHGQPAHPIWDAAPLWPGAYGQVYQQRPGPAEQAGLERFASLAGGDPRYRWLAKLQDYVYRVSFHVGRQERYDNTDVESPNARLGELLAHMRISQLSKELADAAPSRALLPTLMATLHHCTSAESLVAPSQRVAFEHAFEQFRRARSTQLKSQQQQLLARLLDGADLTRVSKLPEDNQALIELSYWSALPLESHPLQWSLALERDSLALSASPAQMAALESALGLELLHSQPDLAALMPRRNNADGGNAWGSDEHYCDALQRSSASILGQALDWQRPVEGLGLGLGLGRGGADSPSEHRQTAATSAPLAPASLRLCASCHTTGAAPPIPFDEPRSLAIKLHAAGYPHGQLIDEMRYRLSAQAGTQRMPLNLHLDEASVTALLTYLERLDKVDPKAAQQDPLGLASPH